MLLIVQLASRSLISSDQAYLVDAAADEEDNGNGTCTFFAFQASVSEEAEITVCVNKMKGVPNSNLLLDGAADFPMVSYSYSVSFEFLDEAQTPKSVSKFIWICIQYSDITLNLAAIEALPLPKFR